MLPFLPALGSFASIIGAGAGVAGAVMSGRAASQAAQGEAARAAALQRLFAQQNPGGQYLAGLGELAEFSLPRINPLDYKEEGFDLTVDAMKQMREQAEITFNQTVGEQNLGQFNTFLSDNLERSNFDFSSLPAEITRTLEGSALSRALGGPAGLAENLSVENKMRLQQQSENSAFKALAFRQGFMPDLLNPIDQVFKLAEFELQNNQQALGAAGVQLGALGQAANLEMSRFGLQAGFVPPNNAGVGALAAGNVASAVGQAATTLGMAFQPRAQPVQQQQAQYALPYGSTSSAAPNWRYSAMGGSSNTNNIYLRG